MRRIVSAAIRLDDVVIASPRHYDSVARSVIAKMPNRDEWFRRDLVEMGFVDQFGDFWSREGAFRIAWDMGQVIRRVGGDDTMLFSENLY